MFASEKQQCCACNKLPIIFLPVGNQTNQFYCSKKFISKHLVKSKGYFRGAVRTAIAGTFGRFGLSALDMGCPGELIPLIRSSVAPSTWRAYGKVWDEWCILAADKP
ncbi:unnamed protein product, partial [Ranitomeya imitator]